MLKYLLLASALIAAPASAETLQEAIASAYAANPEIAAARARLRQVDEGVPIAAAATRPGLDLTGDFTQSLGDAFQDYGQTYRGGVVLSQSIYEGGRVRAGISAAEARIAAQRANLRATEYRIISDTVAAYADVLRTQSIVELNANLIKVLSEQYRASKDRFEVGDLTRTDVAQSEARLAAARASHQAAIAQRSIASERYARLVGRFPSNLQPLPPLPALPESEAEARNAALAMSPTLAAARFNEQAAKEEVRAAKATRGPSLGVNASARYVHGTGQAAGLTGFTPGVGVTAGMPLFSGGAIAARVRQAQAAQSEALENITQTERLVSESTANSFALVQAADAMIAATKIEIAANTLASEGVREENMVGSRDILDVLDAEQELLDSRVSLVQAERDRYVAAYDLFEAMGNLETVLAGAPVGRYDPEANAKRVRGMGWSEFGYDRDPADDRARNQVPLMGPVQ